MVKHVLFFPLVGVHSHFQRPRSRTSARRSGTRVGHRQRGRRSDQRRVFGLRKIVGILQKSGMRTSLNRYITVTVVIVIALGLSSVDHINRMIKITDDFYLVMLADM